MSQKRLPIFTGVATAMVTPFHGGQVDYEAFGKQINFQIENGVGGLLVTGTTGEGSTLSFAEYREIIRFAKFEIGGRVPLLAGCGSNCTERAVELVKIANQEGADAILSVTPYYNKASEKGIFLHYKAINDASEKPILLYHVPSRTGFRFTREELSEIVKLPKVAGIKEASGDLQFLSETVLEFGERMDVYTGNDEQTVSAMRSGAMGVISVVSNLFPREAAEMTRLCSLEKWDAAWEMQKKLSPITRAMFAEVNPIPVKYAMFLEGRCDLEYRLPLCEPSAATKEQIEKAIQEFRK